MFSAGFWMLDSGFWILDTRNWMLDTGCWILDAGGNHIAFYYPASSIQYHHYSFVKKVAWLDLGYYH
jgi:hypothetical protein